MSTIAVNAITNAAGGNTATINGMTPTAQSLQGFRNRLINGNMVIDQRNAGASVTLNDTSLYTLDRWYATEDTDGGMTLQQVSTAPAGFTNSIKITTTTADASLAAGQFCRLVQAVEGYNMADLGWGTASAQSVTLSFWVRSSLTGTFGGAFRNNAGNRSYPFTYSISAADTWEYKTITVAGDTSGTWLTTNGVGVQVQFGLGVGSTYSGTAGAWASSYLLSATGAVSVIGTLNATWYITGVQLEAGSVATPFERRPYTTELQLCQRYCLTDTEGIFAGYQVGTTTLSGTIPIPVSMRATPSVSGTTTVYAWRDSALQTQPAATPTVGTLRANQLNFTFAGFSGFNNGYIANGYMGAGLIFSAEL
jgi:hypothetical protein